MGLCKRSIRKLSLPGWLRVSRLGTETVTRCLLTAPPLEMEVLISLSLADGIILMRRVHTRHTLRPLTMLRILGTLGPLATLHPAITHNTLWAAGGDWMFIHALFDEVYGTQVLRWDTFERDASFPWDIWISCKWMHIVTHKFFL